MARKYRKWSLFARGTRRGEPELTLPPGTRRVGRLLGLVGFLSRRTPYFRGKYRLTDYVFHRWMKHKRLVQIVRLTRHVRMRCNLWDEVQHDIWWLGPRYELKETRFIRRFLKPGMVFFDVGANVGYYSLIASPLIRDEGAIHSFEPVSTQHADFTENISRNGLRNISLNRLIVSDQPGEMEINLGSEDNSGSASVMFAYRADHPTERVACTTLDEYVREHDIRRLDAIKIDTEGHELFVLKGGQRTLARFQPLLLLEVRGEMLAQIGSSREELFNWLASAGYVPYELRRSGRPRRMKQPADGNLVVFSTNPALR